MAKTSGNSVAIGWRRSTAVIENGNPADVGGRATSRDTVEPTRAVRISRVAAGPL